MALTTVPSFSRMISSAATCGALRTRKAATVVILGWAESSLISSVWAQADEIKPGETMTSVKTTSAKLAGLDFIVSPFVIDSYLIVRRSLKTPQLSTVVLIRLETNSSKIA